MKIAVVSDIHGNLDAFESVLRDIDNVGIDRIYCLGDNIGYGPEPVGAIEALQRRKIASVIGNHELALTHRRYLSLFNPTARESLLKTAEMMDDASLHYAAGLPASMVKAGARFVHGFPPDSPLIYLFQVSEKQMKKSLETLEESICFVGHTHDLDIVSFDGIRIQWDRLTQGPRRLSPDLRYIVNVGSVGQPRDGDNRAKYALWDTENHSLEIRFVEYDIASVVRKILKAGLPRAHARRLR
ncbi:MAG: metallophosphoesterase family protein [Desulfobacterales bacterium]|nr:metallophosphoesterase family protein [Desulfobacterales bacterium]